MSNPKQKTCFVIRPFNDIYNRRHENIFAPAIEDAGLSVHLAGGPGVSEITKEIEDGIRKAHICFADVSEDNPNVWYEVGFAYACGKNVAMVCNADMRKFDALPFDVKIKKVISYKESIDSNVQDAAKLRDEIIAHVRELSKTDSPPTPQPSTESGTAIVHDGLTREDLKVLLELMMYRAKHGVHPSIPDLKNHYNPLEVEISIPNLRRAGYIMSEFNQDLPVPLTFLSTEKAQELYESNRDLFYK